jgi:MFS family permease
MAEPGPAIKSGLTRLLAGLLPATTAMYALYQGTQLVLLPAQVEHLDPAGKVASLALVTTVSAIAGLVALPLGGSVSDRTRSRFGRRSPWLVISALLCAVLLAAMGWSTGLAALTVSYTLLWFAANFYQGALTALLPDRVPAERRGAASAVIGMGIPLGTMIGVNVAGRLGGPAAHLWIGVLMVAATALLMVAAREGRFPVPPAPTGRDGGALGYLRAFRNRDFTLAFVGRAALFLSWFTVTGYLFYILSDHVGAARLPGGDVAGAVSLLATISVVASLVSALTGLLADRLNRRKACAAVSSVGLGVSMLLPALSPTWPAMLVFAGLSGIWLGAYVAVDLAVMSLVLPDVRSAGRDFGILAASTGIPLVVSAPLAGLLISTLGYPALFGFGAVTAVLSGVVVLGVRSVR